MLAKHHYQRIALLAAIASALVGSAFTIDGWVVKPHRRRKELENVIRDVDFAEEKFRRAVGAPPPGTPLDDRQMAVFWQSAKIVQKARVRLDNLKQAKPPRPIWAPLVLAVGVVVFFYAYFGKAFRASRSKGFDRGL